MTPTTPCNRQVVAIDGPVASGKTAVGRALARRFGWRLFDTGIMYRAATWQVQNQGVHIDEDETVAELIHKTEFRLVPSSDGDIAELDVHVNGVNATRYLREPAIESTVPIVAAIAGVRSEMVRIQREQADQGCIIVVGRDIGTVVLPNAPVKIFLNASEEVRARRRAAELQDKIDEQMVLNATRQRDAKDRARAASPLIVADDAVQLDTSALSLEASIDQAERIVLERMPALAQPTTGRSSTTRRG